MNDERIILTDEILEQKGFKKGEFEWSGYAMNYNKAKDFVVSGYATNS